MTVYIKEHTIIASLAAIFLKQKRMAVTIGNKIYLHNCNAKDFLKIRTWVCHELTHVHQYKRLGKLKFIIFYFLQSIVNGYHNNKFEKEAQQNEQNISIINKVKFVIL